MVYFLENGTIAVTRGDSCEFSYTPKSRVENAIAVFSVKTIWARDVVIRKDIIPNPDGSLDIDLTHDETNMPSGAYVYDVRFLVGPIIKNNEVVDAEQILTPDEPGVFLILDSITLLKEMIGG